MTKTTSTDELLRAAINFRQIEDDKHLQIIRLLHDIAVMIKLSYIRDLLCRVYHLRVT